MSSPTASPPAFLSPLLSSGTSHFNYRHLNLLQSHSSRNPLRVVAHIDLDAFYAQCEMVRLGIPRDQPLAVQQWDSLIAVNYPARAFSISRMISAQDAKKRCPHLITQHVATFREGEGGKWAYREENDHNIRTDKVSLDPYRTESRKIFATMKAALLDWAESVDQRGCGEKKFGGQQDEQMIRLEKAGIDEAFIDLSALIHATLLKRYPMLQETNEKRGLDEKLPRPPTTALEWKIEDELVDLDAGQFEEDDPDWDDVAMLIGAEIIRYVRRTVWERLKYTCSGGIARNKMMSKLGSASNKPNKQTIVRNRAVQQFLGGFKFTKIRMLGGKLGKHVSELFDTEEVSELLNVPLEQLRAKLDDDTGTWLYGIIRGDDHSEVNPRTQIKSMLSAKSFRPSINSPEQGERWLRILVADIHGRLVEDGMLENKRRPKVMSLHHRTDGQSKSRQIPIPSGRPIDAASLFELSKTLLNQTLNDNKVWPCANLSLSVGGFEDAVVGNQSLDSFFTRGDHRDISLYPSHTLQEPMGSSHMNKKRKVSNNIQRFFASSSPIPDGIEYSMSHTNAATSEKPSRPQGADDEVDTALGDGFESEAAPSRVNQQNVFTPSIETSGLSFVCPRCKNSMPEVEREEHDDWHFAKDLAAQESKFMSREIQARSQGGGRGRKKIEKGQTQLAFR